MGKREKSGGKNEQTNEDYRTIALFSVLAAGVVLLLHQIGGFTFSSISVFSNVWGSSVQRTTTLRVVWIPEQASFARVGVVNGCSSDAKLALFKTQKNLLHSRATQAFGYCIMKRKGNKTEKTHTNNFDSRDKATDVCYM